MISPWVISPDLTKTCCHATVFTRLTLKGKVEQVECPLK